MFDVEIYNFNIFFSKYELPSKEGAPKFKISYLVINTRDDAERAGLAFFGELDPGPKPIAFGDFLKRKGGQAIKIARIVFQIAQLDFAGSQTP